MTKLFKELMEADQIIALLYKKNENLKRGKFGYAWSKFYKKNIEQIITEINNKVMDNRVECALTDEKTKELLTDNDKGYKYSKEGMKTLLANNRKIIEEYYNKEIIITPYFCKDIPKGLLEEEIEILKGLIIK